jgi:fatty acid desaturase
MPSVQFYAPQHEGADHAARRMQILARYDSVGEITALTGPSVLTALWTGALIGVHVWLGWLASGLSWPLLFATAYLVGGLFAHNLTLCIHEAVHGLVFASPTVNYCFAQALNLVLMYPVANTYIQWHMAHHMYTGDRQYDPAVPARWEARLLHPSVEKRWIRHCISVPFRAVKVMTLPVCYFVRVTFFKSSTQWPTCVRFAYLALEWTLTTAWYLLLVYYLPELRRLWIYLGVSTAFSCACLHPTSVVYLLQHHTFNDFTGAGTHTFSYDGFLNIFMMNAGYHSVHHDFPDVAFWWRPHIHRLATDFYTGDTCYRSATHGLLSYLVGRAVRYPVRAYAGEGMTHAGAEGAGEQGKMCVGMAATGPGGHTIIRANAATRESGEVVDEACWSTDNSSEGDPETRAH